MTRLRGRRCGRSRLEEGAEGREHVLRPGDGPARQAGVSRAEPGTDNEVNEERIIIEYEKNADGILSAKKL